MIRLTTDHSLSDHAVQVLEGLEQHYDLGMQFTAGVFPQKTGVIITDWTTTMQELEEKGYIEIVAPNTWKYTKALPRPW